VPLNSNALLTLIEAKEALSINLADTTQDAVVELMVNGVSDRIKQHTHRQLTETTHADIRVDGPNSHFLFVEWPIISITTISVDDAVQSVWIPGDSGSPRDKDVYVRHDLVMGAYAFYRWNKWRGLYGVANVRLQSFKAGYKLDSVVPPSIVIPGDIKQATVFAVARWYHKRDKARYDVLTQSIEGQTTTFATEPLPPETVKLLEPHIKMVYGAA